MNTCKLTDMCCIQYGYAFDSASFTEDATFPPLVRIRDVKRGFSETYYSGNYAEEYIVRRGDILIGMDGEFNIARWQSEDALLNQRVCKIIPKQQVDASYILFALTKILKKIEDRTAFVTVKHLSAKELNKIELRLPNYKKQVLISSTLEKALRIINHRRTQLAKLDELIKCRFVEMFGDCRSNPKQWDTKKLEEIASVGSSKRVFVEELIDEGIPFYRGTEVGALAEGQNITPELFISASHYQSLCEASGRPVKGDLLMPSICPDGRIWIVDSDTPFYFKDGRVLWVHDIREQFNPVFLQYTLKDRIIADYASIASGTTFAELKIFSLKSCKIFDAPLSLQTTFASFVRRIDKFKFACFFFQLITVLQKIIIFFRNFLICFLF